MWHNDQLILKEYKKLSKKINIVFVFFSLFYKFTFFEEIYVFNQTLKHAQQNSWIHN